MRSIVKNSGGKWPTVWVVLFAFSALLLNVPMVVKGQTGVGGSITGKVVDQAGLAVVNAEIVLRSSEGSTSCKPDYQGIFKCYLETDGKIEVTIRADGFSILRQFVTNIQENNDIGEFILRPAVIRESVIVSAVRAPTSVQETPASVYSIDRDGVETTPATSVDEVLKRGVGFSLFRRAGSRTSNPTTQGASIRGVNASGASRSLVLLDGVPINDPFGGWVVWSRVPKATVERIDMLRGGSSAFYGSGSLGGTIVIVPKSAARKYDFSGQISAGTSGTYEGSLFAGFRNEEWTVDVSGAAFQTRGYRIVEQPARGPVDDYANSKNTNFTVRIARSIGNDARVSGSTSVFGEARNNGTPVQKNRSRIRSYSLAGEFGLGLLSSRLNGTRVRLRAFGGTQVFDQKFSAVFGDRSGEVLVRLQRVPAQQLGASGDVYSLYERHSFAFGAEAKEIRGSSDEIGFFGGNASSKSGSGGRERRYGVFFQDIFRLNSRINLIGAIRYDRWSNYSGYSVLRSIAADTVVVTAFPDRSESALSPSGAILAGIDDNWSAYFSAGRSFRSPTLNELYRGFRVGNVVTGPNDSLRAERATSIEGGIRFSGTLLFFQANAFRTKVEKAIANVTFDPGPPLILRRRENAGAISSSGFEIEAELRKGDFSLAGGYLFLNAKVDRFSSNVQLEGRKIPQVPAHQMTIQASFRPGEKWRMAVLARAASSQFDDDINSLRLERYIQLDLYGSRKIGGSVFVFAAIENLLNARYSVNLTPVRTVSAPFAFRAGLRFN